MEFIEGALLRGHGFVVLPGLRDHHHQRLRERPAGQVEEFEDVVHDRRVRSIQVDRRQRLGQLISEELGAELSLAGVHPVDVAAQRVDLAVV